MINSIAILTVSSSEYLLYFADSVLQTVFCKQSV